MAKVKGIVLQTEGDKCILLAPDAAFIKVKVPHPVKPGQEIVADRGSNWHKGIASLAAVLILAIVASLYPPLRTSAEPVAYLSLDIIPSVQLGLNKRGKVVEIKAFEPAGEKLLLSMSETKPEVYQTVQALVATAIKQGYLVQGKSNLILVTYTGSGQFTIDEQQIENVVAGEVSKSSLAAEIAVIRADLEVQRVAEQKQISQGKFFVYEALRSKGRNISLEQMNQDGISKQDLIQAGVPMMMVGVPEIPAGNRSKNKEGIGEPAATKPEPVKGSTEGGMEGGGRGLPLPSKALPSEMPYPNNPTTQPNNLQGKPNVDMPGPFSQGVPGPAAQQGDAYKDRMNSRDFAER